jgi:hypothetical protein
MNGYKDNWFARWLAISGVVVILLVIPGPDSHSDRPSSPTPTPTTLELTDSVTIALSGCEDTPQGSCLLYDDRGQGPMMYLCRTPECHAPLAVTDLPKSLHLVLQLPLEGP